ncbi:hypothetical protein HA402_002985 [Bradysia odoriphaga]|nr:hypothetical protein HA402_002985 [Bradysia odoriphaga]
MEVDAGEEKLMYANEVRRQLLDLFKNMVNKITSTNFDEIFKKFEENDDVVTNVDQNVDTFKTNLYRNISENFKDMWHLQEIDLQLNALKFCKDKCKNNTTSWRPTGQTPEEQTKYLRIHYLRKKIAFVDNAIAAQHKSFENLSSEVLTKRSRIGALIQRRAILEGEMNMRMEIIDKNTALESSNQKDHS